MADERIPTEDEIRQLPRLARIAFAARCARRVQPLFQHFWPDAPEQHRTAVAKAIDLTEKAATGYVVATRIDDDEDEDDGDAVYAAARAADAADAVNNSAADVAAAAATGYAADAASAAAAVGYAATAADDTTRNKVIEHLRQDFDLLRSLVTKEKWSDETPVPPSVFGPMWPRGTPQGWPGQETEQPTLTSETKQKIRGLVLALIAKADTSPEVIEEGLVRLYTAANQYHMARGGGVLNPDSFQQMISSLVPVGRD